MAVKERTLAKKTTSFAKANRPLISFTLIFETFSPQASGFQLGEHEANTQARARGHTKKGSLKETLEPAWMLKSN